MKCAPGISVRLSTWRRGAPLLACPGPIASRHRQHCHSPHRQCCKRRRVLQTLVTIDFGESSITLGRDIYGARLTEGGDGTSSRAVLSMLPLKRCLGMYKDASCDNAFGFSAVAEPAMMQLPRISCLLTRSMPNPPPPKPPLPPPSPPPGFNIDPGKCTNGGHAHFIVAPHSIPSQAALQTWELNVHLNLWLIGMHVVIDFPSLRHAKHALHVSAVRPPDVAKLVAVTQHSAIVELLETAARDFQFEALGDVESLEVICDLSNVRPFPPPPPPHYEWDDPDRPDEGETQQPPGDDDGIGGGGDTPYSYYDPSPNDDASLQSSSPPPRARTPRPPRSPPEPPSPPPARGGQGVSGLRIVLIGVLLVGMVALGLQQRPQEVAKLAKRLRGTPVGRRLLRSPVGRSLLLLEARYLGVATAADLDGDDEEGGTPRALPAPKPKPKKATRKSNSEVEPLQTSAAAESMVNEAEDDDGEQRRKRGTLFVVHLGGDEGQLEGLLRLEAVHELKELQRLVSLECDRLGVDMQRGFRMTFQDADGVNATVSKSCSMERIRGASRLELTPKSSSQGGNGVKAPPARALRNDDIDAPPVERL